VRMRAAEMMQGGDVIVDPGSNGKSGLHDAPNSGPKKE
jgi:hypothetical protein